MTTDIEPQIGAVDAATLEPIVQRALQRATARLVQWTAEPLRPNRGGGLGPGVLYRFAGAAEAQGELLPWSLILKRTAEPGADEPPTPGDSWRRELDFYRWELAGQLPGLRAPACYAILEEKDAAGRQVYSLWLEEVQAETDGQWSPADYGQAARHLGRFNGAFLVDLPLPSAPWMNQSGTRGYVERAAPWVACLQENGEHPLVRPAYPPAAVESYLRNWQARDVYLKTLESLPQTLCHRDAQRSNLFLQRDDAGGSDLVAVDWTTLGHGNVGLDIIQLTGFALFGGDFDVTQAALLDEAVFAGYVDGLRDAGWQGDAAWARLGYAAAAIRARTTGVFRYLQMMLNEKRRAQLQQVWQAQGITLDEVMARIHQADVFFAGLLDEADELRARLL